MSGLSFFESQLLYYASLEMLIAYYCVLLILPYLNFYRKKVLFLSVALVSLEIP